DATVSAQKLLSCVYRTGQRFGVAHIIDVLTGKQTDKIDQYRHQTLSTFGIGKEHSEQQWRSIVRQLLVRGFLRADVERYGALVLTEACRPLLRGDITLFLREDLYPSSQKPRKKPPRKYATVSDEDGDLWEALRLCRKRLADEQGVPPYVIFHDATLMEMMEYRPRTEQQLLSINGVGQAKLERYGEKFLKVINEAV
ncbi:MAG TPA: RQC domain-containing protein, partial [Gammaproteobacteria bacterium]